MAVVRTIAPQRQGQRPRARCTYLAGGVGPALWVVYGHALWVGPCYGHGRTLERAYHRWCEEVAERRAAALRSQGWASVKPGEAVPCANPNPPKPHRWWIVVAVFVVISLIQAWALTR